jgi:hypothetical protein
LVEEKREKAVQIGVAFNNLYIIRIYKNKVEEKKENTSLFVIFLPHLWSE